MGCSLAGSVVAVLLMLPFRSRLGETWLYLHLGWGGILGAYFGMQTGMILSATSTLAGYLLIVPVVWYRWKMQSISWGPIRVVFYLGSISLLVIALAMQLVD